MTSEAATIFTDKALAKIFPPDRADQFFEALLGDASEGAYDISLHYNGSSGQQHLQFELRLTQRPGQCLACNLTYGLPEVFSRHPIINLTGVAAAVSTMLGKNPAKVEWSLGNTQSTSNTLHKIPFRIQLAD